MDRPTYAKSDECEHCGEWVLLCDLYDDEDGTICRWCLAVRENWPKESA